MAGETELPVDPAAAAAPEPAAPAVEAPKHPIETPTLLEEIKPPTAPEPAPEPAPADKPVDAPAEAPKPADPKPEDKPAEPEKPVEEVATPEPIPLDAYKFTFGENVKADDEKVAEFTKFASENRLKPEEAQKAVDMFKSAATSFAQEMANNQIRVWHDLRAKWREGAKSDPLIGGSGFDTSMQVIARMRDKFVSDSQPGSKEYDADAREFEEMLRVTGVGDHPAFLKYIYRVGAKFDEPRMVTAPPSPTKNNHVNPARNNSLYREPASRQ